MLNTYILMLIIFLFVDIVYVVIAFTCKRLGSNENGINLEAIGVCYMVLLWGCSYLIICMEHGNLSLITLYHLYIFMSICNKYKLIFNTIYLLQTEVDIIEDIDEYQTWPGWFILLFRSAIMIWFLYELRNTMTYEHNTQKLNFLLHFGASSLVWFIYLPIIALIALQVSALWRFKLLLGE